MRLNVLDFFDPQAAFDAALDGDSIYFPGEKVYVAPPGGWRIKKSLEIYGDGPGNPANERGTVLKPSAEASPDPEGEEPGNHVLVLDPDGGDLSNVEIRALRISGAGVEGYPGHGIYHITGATNKLSQLRIERVAIEAMGKAGISLIGQAATGSTGDVVGVLLSECGVEGCAWGGIALKQAFQVYGVATHVAGNGREGIVAEDSQFVARGCSLSGNKVESGEAELVLRRCTLARVDGCKIEDFGEEGVGILIDRCPGVANVGGCHFKSGGTSIEIADADPAGPGLLLPNRHDNVATAVKLPDSAVGCVVLPQYIDGSEADPIELPDSAEPSATLAVPGVVEPSEDRPSGLLLPALDAEPDTNLQGGMLARVEADIVTYVEGSPSGSFQKLALSPEPSAISAFQVGSPKGRTSLFVTWTAPTEPDWAGPVLEYELRMSTSPITEGNPGSVVPAPEPESPGNTQCVSLVSLTSCTTYYFSIKWKDHSGRWSPLAYANGATRCSGSLEVECE